MIFLNFLIFASSATVLCAQKLTEAWSPNAENSTCRETDISERDVYFHIFKDYSNLTRPVLDFRDTVIVNISVRFEKIVDVLEKEQLVIFKGYLVIVWNNPFLNWEQTWPMNCVKNLIVPAQEVWLPDITNPLSGDVYSFVMQPHHKVEIRSSGQTYYFPSGVITSFCLLNLRYFPFDEQHCSLKLDSWVIPENRQRLQFGETPFSQDARFIENGQWSIKSYEWHINAVFDEVDNNTYDMLEFRIAMRRKPTYYMIHLLVPIYIVSTAQAVTFALPQLSDIRLHVSFTTLVAFGVFQQLITEDIPRASGHATPLLTVCVDVQMGLVAMVIVVNGILLLTVSKPIKHHEAAVGVDSNHNQWARKIVVGLAERLGSLKSSSDSPPHMSTSHPLGMVRVAKHIESAAFFVYVSAIVIAPLVVFVLMPATSPAVVSKAE